MIRKLCFFLLGAFSLCASSHANLIIDNFSSGVNVGAASIADRGDFISTLNLVLSPPAVMGAPTVTFDENGYLASGFGTNQIMTFTYSNFGNNGSTLGNVNGPMTFTGLQAVIVPDAISDWNLLIGGIGIPMSESFNPINGTGVQAFPIANLDTATTLTLQFTYVGTGNGSLTFGGVGNDLIAIEAPAVPEPTTLLMLGSVVGLGLTYRRRRR